jgi:WD40 repeat protein
VTRAPRREEPRRLRVIALSSTGRLLAAGTPSGGVQIWDIQNPASPHKIVDSTGRLNDLRFSRNTEYVAIANRNLTLFPLAREGKPIVVRSDQANYGSVRFSSDGRLLLTVNGKGEVMTIDLASGAVRLVHCCSSIWGDVEFGLDESQAVWAGHWPGVWDLRSMMMLGRLTKSREFMAFGPISIDRSDPMVYMGSQDGRVYQWNIDTRRLLGKSQAQSGYVHTLAVLGRNGWVAYAAEGGPVHLWHPSTGASRTVQAARATTNLVFDESRNRMAFGTDSGQVEFWDLIEGRLLESLPGAATVSSPIP